MKCPRCGAPMFRSRRLFDGWLCPRITCPCYVQADGRVMFGPTRAGD